MIEDQGRQRRATPLRTRGTIGGQAQIIRANGVGWHMHGGGFHIPSPKDLKIPSITFVQFITIWLTGDPDNGLPPLSKIGPYHWKGYALEHRWVCGDM